MVIDNGATATILNKLFAEKHNFNLRPSMHTVMNADTRVTKIEGEIECELSFPGSREYIINMMVLEQCEEWDVLLGNDFMEIDKPSILIASRKMVFPDGTIVNFIKNNEEESNLNLSVNQSCQSEKEHTNQDSTSAQEEWEMFDPDWGEPEINSKMNLFEKYFKKHGYFIKKKEYNKEEKQFMNNYHNITDLIDKQLLRKKKNKSIFFEIPKTLKSNDVNKLFDFLAKNYDLFADDMSDLKQCNYSPFRILTDKVKPIYRPPFRKPQKEISELERHVKELLSQGMIRPSRSPWSFPAFLVPKGSDTRMVIDYRELNKITKSHPFPIPRIVDIFDKMVNSKYFSVVDLKSGFNQVLMHQNSVEKTAFATPFGHYEWLVLPFGLKNAPSEFCRMMNNVLGDLENVLVYLDDICVHTDTVEKHFIVLTKVFSRLREINLKINIKKVTFFATSIKILGHVIEYNKISLDKEKLIKIKERSEPVNVKDLQTFLGICNFYRRFIKNFADITKPLTDLLKKDKEFEWNDTCKKSFEELKKLLCSHPILRLPDLSRAFILYTDASQYALGAILGQKDDEGNEYVVAYASRNLKNAELNYTVTEKECLAVIFGLQQFRTYLYGTKFIIFTDHIALNWLMTIKDPVGRLCRWSLLIQTYDFVIGYRKGSKHLNADTLSRPVLISIDREFSLINNNLTHKDIYQNEALKFFVSMGAHPRNANKSQVKKIEAEARLYLKNKDGIWYRRNINETKYFKVPELEERVKLIEKAHLLGHFQLTSTYNRLREEYYWHDMLSDIKKYIQKCQPCQRNERARAMNHPAQSLSSDILFDKIQIDVIHGLDSSDNNNDSVYIFSETMTGFVKLYPVSSKSANTSLNCFILWVFQFGAPKTILTDRGTEFVNETIKKFNESCGIEHCLTAAYNPRCNGKSERNGQTVMSSLRKHCEAYQEQWDKWIPYIEFAYNTRVHSTTGYAPYELVFGKKPNIFKGLSDTDLSPNEENELLVRSEQLRNLIENIRPKAIDNNKLAKERQRRNQDKTQNVTLETLPKDSWVMIKNEKIKRKLDSRYQGRYQVIGQDDKMNYILKDATGSLVENKFPLHQLKKVSEVEGKGAEIQKILKHQTKNGALKFLVKWKGLPVSDAEWVNESDFHTKEIIRKYFKNNPEKETTEPIRKGERIRNQRHEFLGNIIYVINLLFIFLPLIGCEMVNEDTYNFKKIVMLSDKWNFNKVSLPFCSIPTNKWPIDVNNICTEEIDLNNIKREKRFQKIIEKDSRLINITKEGEDLVKYAIIDVYTKEPNEVVGIAYQCYSKEIKFKFSKTFFFHPIDQKEERIIHLTESQCRDMIEKNTCGPNGNKMTCEENKCWYSEKIIPKYSWWVDNEVKVIECKVHNITISAEHADSFIFGNKCRSTDLACQLHDSIIVWSRKNIHTCPFKRIIHRTNFKIENDGFTSYKLNLNFIFHQTERHCSSNLIKTVEGLYIKFSNLHEDLFYEKTGSKGFGEVNLAEITELTLASLDFISKTEDQRLKTVFDLSCKIFQNSIQMLTSKISKEFVKVKTPNNNETILYVENGFVYKPICYQMNFLKVRQNLNDCNKEIEVEVSKNINGKYQSGLLTSQGIVKTRFKGFGLTQKEHEECHTLRQIFYLDKKNMLVRENTRTRIVKNGDIQQEPFKFIKVVAGIEVNHSKILEEKYNIGKIIEMELTTEDILPNEFRENVEDQKTNYVKKLFDYINFTYRAVLWLIFSLIVVFVLVYLLYLIISYNMIPRVTKSFVRLFVKNGKNNIKLAKDIEKISSNENLTNDELLYNYYSNKIKSNKDIEDQNEELVTKQVANKL